MRKSQSSTPFSVLPHVNSKATPLGSRTCNRGSASHSNDTIADRGLVAAVFTRTAANGELDPPSACMRRSLDLAPYNV
jgi:hypothetical protein